FHERAAPPDSAELSAAWRPYAEECFDRFGVNRCLFESNFPVDKQSCSYSALANAFKRLTRGFSEAERSAFFSHNAARTYRIDIGQARRDAMPAHGETRP
ncbi:MAG TPA: amidohydrolase family protein, partial [Inquilinus sp.]